MPRIDQRCSKIRSIFITLLVLMGPVHLSPVLAQRDYIPECDQETVVARDLHLLKELGDRCPTGSPGLRKLISTAIEDSHEKHQECNKLIGCYGNSQTLLLVLGPRFGGRIGSYVAYIVRQGKLESRFRIKLLIDRKKYLELYDPPRTFFTLLNAQSMYKADKRVLALIAQCIATSAELDAWQLTGHQYRMTLVKPLSKDQFALALAPANHTWYNRDKFLVFIYDQQKQRFICCFDFSASDNALLLSRTLVRRELPECPPDWDEHNMMYDRNREVLTAHQLLLAESGYVYAFLKWREPFWFSGCRPTRNSRVQEYFFDSALRRHTTISLKTDPSGHKLDSYCLWGGLGPLVDARSVVLRNGTIVLNASVMYVPETRCNGNHVKSWETRYHDEQVQFMLDNVRANKSLHRGE